MVTKKKIVMITKNFALNGISTVVSNYCDNLSAEYYEITILAGSEIAVEYRNKYENSNVKIIECPSKESDAKGYYKKIYHYLKNNPVNIVHIHGNSAICIIEVIFAFLCRVKTRIIHSHNTSCNHIWLHRFLRPFLNIICTDRCACSENAGKWMFGSKPFTIIHNAFDIEHFQYDPTKRSKIRKELGLKNELVVGHVGLFNEQKNQEYLIRIFEEYYKTHIDAYLLLVGEGPDFEKIKDLAYHTKCSENIIFYGSTSDPAGLYSVMDIFVFPSRFEGLPLVLLEAQVSGLPCLVSDVVSKEANLGGDMQWISIKKDPTNWAEKMHLVSEKERKMYVNKHTEALSKYQIKNNMKILEKIYNK